MSRDPRSREPVRAVDRPGAIPAIACAVLGLSVVPTAAAHEGSAHAGLPHWVLLAVLAAGLGIGFGSVYLARTRASWSPRRTVSGVLLGVVVAMVGTIGLVEIQIEPVGTTSTGRRWYPLVTGVAGVAITTTSLFVGRVRWPDRPRYAALGIVLGGWVLYPVAVPGAGYRHPVGYLVVASVPFLVGYIVWRDVRPALRRDVLDRLSRRVGVLVSVLFAAFFTFSSGLFSVDPDGVTGQTEAFVTVASFANPLVIWPAVEFYLPSIPLGGAVSVGTAIVTALLAGLVGINASLFLTIWQRNVDVSSSGGTLGAVATVGATTCTCCGPVVYAVASAFVGATASPLYWAFLDPLSPVGALFLVTAIVLLAASAIQFATRLDAAGVCTLS